MFEVSALFVERQPADTHTQHTHSRKNMETPDKDGLQKLEAAQV